jgi:radical SAM protein with 4Fe4S-binding SPASM domain
MDWDLTRGQRLELLGLLFHRSRELLDKVEVLTTCGPMDGVYILERLKEEQPEVCEDVRKLLGLAGGCSAGAKICGIGPDGSVHPCQFMVDITVGNVKERSLREIWRNSENELLSMFRDKQALKGKCGACEYKDICGGCRIRAYHAKGDYMQEDPACFYEPTAMKVKS